jgi:hypothetical protein
MRHRGLDIAVAAADVTDEAVLDRALALNQAATA